MKNSIFISYSRADIDKVEPFVKKINDKFGNVCWFDKKDIESGALFENKIKTAIKHAKAILFFHSKESLASEWTYREMTYAHSCDEHKYVVPIVFDEKGIGGWFKVIFGNKDFKHYQNEEHVSALYKDIAKWLGARETKSWRKEEDGFTICFPNNEIIETPRVIDALKNCILKVGLKKVFELGLNHNNDALLFKRKPDGLNNIEEISQGRSTYYIQRLKGKNVLDILKQISDRLNLGLIIYSKYSEEEEPPRDYVAEIEIEYHQTISDEDLDDTWNKAQKYFNGSKKKASNYKKAYELYCIAAAAGEPAAWNQLGLIQENGYLGEINSEAAFSFYRQSHTLGNPTGTLNLASCYIKGFGVEQDVEQGIGLINDLCEREDVTGEYKGDVCLYIADLLTYENARPLIQKAIEYGNEHAQEELDIRTKYPDHKFVLIIDDVFSITGRGTVATGIVAKGIISVGDEVTITHNGEERKTIVTAVEMFGKLLDCGIKGDNVGLLLRGINKDDIAAGDAILIK